MVRISGEGLFDDDPIEIMEKKVNSKRAYNEDSIVFETRIVDREGTEVTVGAIGMLVEEASKLSWKHFKNYMVGHCIALLVGLLLIHNHFM